MNGCQEHIPVVIFPPFDHVVSAPGVSPCWSKEHNSKYKSRSHRSSLVFIRYIISPVIHTQQVTHLLPAQTAPRNFHGPATAVESAEPTCSGRTLLHTRNQDNPQHPRKKMAAEEPMNDVPSGRGIHCMSLWASCSPRCLATPVDSICCIFFA
jgi:hypothetical protein